MAKRGRKPGFVMPEYHRAKIANAQIEKRLLAHFAGELELTQSQVTVGIALLKKYLPDLQSTELKGDQDNPVVVERIVTGVVRHTDIEPLATDKDTGIAVDGPAGLAARH